MSSSRFSSNTVLQPVPVNALPPEVSVILPVYNGAKTVAPVVASVLAQTFSNLELIVVDDGSTDGTIGIISQINDARIRVIAQANQGVAAARNAGVGQARGQWLAFIDADDCWLPEKLATQMAIAQQQQKPCMVFSGYYAVDANNRLINRSPLFDANGNILETILDNESVMLPSTTLMHRSVFDSVGGFQSRCYHEDRAFFIEACKMYPAFPTGQRHTLYRQATDGRCRKVLENYDDALAAELSIVAALSQTLTPQQLNRLEVMQKKSLFYRFLMYGFYPSARKLYPQVCNKMLLKDKKGMLGVLSMVTGINWMILARFLVQSLHRLFHPVLLPISKNGAA